MSHIKQFVSIDYRYRNGVHCAKAPAVVVLIHSASNLTCDYHCVYYYGCLRDCFDGHTALISDDDAYFITRLQTSAG